MLDVEQRRLENKISKRVWGTTNVLLLHAIWGTAGQLCTCCQFITFYGLNVKADQWAWEGLGQVLNQKHPIWGKHNCLLGNTHQYCSSIYNSTPPSDKTSHKMTVHSYPRRCSLGLFNAKFASLCGFCWVVHFQIQDLYLFPCSWEIQPTARRWNFTENFYMISLLFNARVSHTMYTMHLRKFRMLTVGFCWFQPSSKQTASLWEAIPPGFTSGVK